MEGRGGILGEAAGEAELQEGVHVLVHDWARVGGRALVSVGEADVDDLGKEDDVCVLVPGAKRNSKCSIGGQWCKQ